nr:uncharacterized protein LOC117687484 [Crassostrea gigas]
MDLESNKKIDVQLVQSNEVKGSTHMELLGLKRGLRDLEFNNIQVQDLVTDRHVMIKSNKKKDIPEINHYFDVCHIAKGISRKLENAAKKRGAGQIRPWIKGIVNHTYWVAASSGDNNQLKLDKWRSISNHIINVHNHDSEIFPEYEHGELEPRDWMQQGYI